MGHRLVAVDDPDERPGGERAEDRLEAEAVGEDDEECEQQEGASDPDLRGRVLEADKRCGQAG